MDALLQGQVKGVGSEQQRLRFTAGAPVIATHINYVQYLDTWSRAVGSSFVPFIDSGIAPRSSSCAPWPGKRRRIGRGAVALAEAPYQTGTVSRNSEYAVVEGDVGRYNRVGVYYRSPTLRCALCGLPAHLRARTGGQGVRQQQHSGGHLTHQGRKVAGLPNPRAMGVGLSEMALS